MPIMKEEGDYVLQIHLISVIHSSWWMTYLGNDFPPYKSKVTRFVLFYYFIVLFIHIVAYYYQDDIHTIYSVLLGSMSVCLSVG